MLHAKKHCHPHSASAPGHCGPSIAQFLNQITLSLDFSIQKCQILVLRTAKHLYRTSAPHAPDAAQRFRMFSSFFCFLLHSYATAPRPIFQTQTPFLSRKPAKGRVLNSISCCHTDHSLFTPAKPASTVTQHGTSSTFERKNAISSSQRST